VNPAPTIGVDLGGTKVRVGRVAAHGTVESERIEPTDTGHDGDLKAGVLAHVPPGIFTANAAWLALAVLVHNLARWTLAAAGEAGRRPPPKRHAPSWCRCPPGSCTAPDVSNCGHRPTGLGETHSRLDSCVSRRSRTHLTPHPAIRSVRTAPTTPLPRHSEFELGPVGMPQTGSRAPIRGRVPRLV
jgi:hypothetical protein